MKLSGLRVVDLSQFMPGPLLATHLAEHGAQVTKIEPPAGDPTRGASNSDHAFFAAVNRGKRSIALDLKHPEARTIALKLMNDADVVIEGDAGRVTDPGAVARIAKAWADNGWPAEPDDSGSGITAPFNAPSQGPPPWNVYRIEPRSAIVTLTAEPGGLTRFRF